MPADEDGYATIDFWVGDIGDFRVLAGSPENHGPAEFTLQALSPAELHGIESGEYAKKYLAATAKRAGKKEPPGKGPSRKEPSHKLSGSVDGERPTRETGRYAGLGRGSVGIQRIRHSGSSRRLEDGYRTVSQVGIGFGGGVGSQ